MEDRNLRSLHKRVGSQQPHSLTETKKRERSAAAAGGGSFGAGGLLNVSNEKYLAIIYQYVLPEHAWKILKWLNTISEDNKKVSNLIMYRIR